MVFQNTAHTHHNPQVQKRGDRRRCLQGVRGIRVNGTETRQTVRLDIENKFDF